MSPQMAVLGFVVGAFVGMSGVGAGVLMAPVLILAGVPPQMAVGTDLAYSAVTKLVGAVRCATQGLVDRAWLLWSSVGSLPGTAVGAEAARWLPAGSAGEHVLRLAVAGALIVASTAVVVRDRIGGGGARPEADLARTRPWRVSAMGMLIGVLVGLTSIGSGSLFMTFLLMNSAMTVRRAVATDIANAAVLTWPAALLHLAGGSVDPGLAGNLLIGSIPGILLGTRLAQHVPVRPLKYGVALLVIAGGLRMLL